LADIDLADVDSTVIDSTVIDSTDIDRPNRDRPKMTAREKPGLRGRIAVSTVIGLASGWICFFFLRRLHQGAGDFSWAIHLAQRFLAGQNPYDTPYEQYPFTAGVLALPFVRVAPEWAAGIFYGLSSALLALGLTRSGYHRLLVFLAYPYWVGLLTVQWSTAIMASAFFPLLIPVTMAKPQVGLPVFLTRFSKRGFWACVALGVLSLILMPHWPRLWIGQMGYYQHFYALLVLPGPLIALALMRWRDRDAWLLFSTSLMPQRWFFDAFILWLIPKSRREILATVLFSWCAGFWRSYHPPVNSIQVGRWIVLSIYMPMLAIILSRKPRETDPTEMSAEAELRD
jgi:hypothetical protein